VDLNRVHHVGVVVHDIDAALAVYRDALGMRFVVEDTIEDQGVRAVLLDTGGGYLELLQPVVPDTGIARYLEKRGEGLHHICLEVDGIEAALAGLKARGVELIDETPRPGLTGMIAFIHPNAAHSVLIELVDAKTALRS
jgi:methylmalonyl-CoA/ethylmalonyl-CoA epimerase